MKLDLRHHMARPLHALGALGERDRLALLLVGLTLAGAAEWFLVWPVHEQRLAIEHAVRAEVQAVDDATLLAQGARRQAQAEQQARAEALAADLARLGMGEGSGHRLSELLARALAPQAVQVLALRELGVEEFQVDAAANAGAPAVASGELAATAAARTLYRHRFELRLAGEVPALLAAVAALERQVRPLRAERVRMASPDGHAVELTLTLAVLASERVWLAL